MMRKLLLIENDPLMELVLETVLGSAGYEVVTTVPEHGVATALAWNPDIVTVDCDDCWGFELGWHIGHEVREASPTVVMLMLSSHAKAVAEVGQTARGQVFNAGLPKPFSIAYLLDTVAACCVVRPRFGVANGT